MLCKAIHYTLIALVCLPNLYSLPFIAQSLHTPSGGRCLAFSRLDLIKIFGRLSNASKIGHVIPNSNSYLTRPNSDSADFRYKQIFNNSPDGISLPQFKDSLQKLEFEWPLVYRSNKKPVYKIPTRMLDKYRNQNSIGYAEFELYCKCKNGEGNDKENTKSGACMQMNNIADSAIEAVFQTLADGNEKLTPSLIVSLIKYKSPLLQLLNWQAFLDSQWVAPDD